MAAPPAVAEVELVSPMLVIGNWEDVQKLVRTARGKVVVVNIWTTTCATCRDEFPKFLALRKLAGPERLELISVACDYDGIAEKPPEYYRERVERFLREQKATDARHVLLDRAFVDFLEDLQLSSTPAVFVYDKTGRLAKRFDNDGATGAADEFTSKDVREKVAALMSDE